MTDPLREWVRGLTPAERRLVRDLVLELDARPVLDRSAPGPELEFELEPRSLGRLRPVRRPRPVPLEAVPLLDKLGVRLADPARAMIGRRHADPTDTELDAARRVAPRSGTQRALVLEELRRRGTLGATDFELWTALEGKAVRPHVAGTRREELIRDGWPIVDSGSRRPTDTGAPAIVWTLVDDDEAVA